MASEQRKSTPIYTEMRQRLLEVRARFYRERILYGSVITATALAGILLLLSLIEAFVNGSTGIRATLFILGSVSFVAFAVWFIVVPVLRWKRILRGLSEREFAERVGEKFPSIKDRLRNILEIFEEQNAVERKEGVFHPEYSPELIDASFADLQAAAAPLNFTDVVSYRMFRRAAKKFSVVAVLTLFLFWIPDLGLPAAVYRLAHYRTDFRQPPQFVFLIQPGNTEIVKGESVPVSVSLLPNAETAQHLHSDLPKTIVVSLRRAGSISDDHLEVRADSMGQFRTTLATLREPVEYFAEAEGVQSERYEVTIVDRPVVRSLKVRVTPPAYSNLPSQTLDDNIGDVLALPGSLIRWQVEGSKTLRKAGLVFDDGRERILARERDLYGGQELLQRRATYHVSFEDEEGLHNVNPIEYKLEVLTDEVPTVIITAPGRNVDATGEMQLPMLIKIHDDYGCTSLKLAYRLVHSRYERPKEEFSAAMIPLPTDEKKNTDAEIDFQWDISKLGLVPEDVIEYHAEVLDNDNVSGPKKGVSESFLLRLPSLDEVFADADKGQKEAGAQLKTSLDEAQDLKKNLDELSQEMKKNQPLDWQKQKKVEETLKRYQELAKKVDDVSKSVDAVTQEMQKNNILSSETLAKYNELQHLLQEINSPEFQEAMKRMQQAMQSVSPEQLRQAMQQVQFSEETFRQSIERTMELLKRIQVEQKMDEMVKRANELQKQQEELQKETANAQPSDEQKNEELARKQDDINRQLSDLQQQLADLRKKMEEFPKEMPMKELDKSEQAAHDSTMEQSTEESSKQLRSGKTKQSLESQKKASAAMKQMSQKFSEMQEQMLSNAMNEAMTAMRKAMRDLLEISQQEEDLKNQSQTLNPNSQQFRENAEKQLNLQSDLSNVTNNLVELSQKSFVVTPEMGRAIGKAMGMMAQAMTGLEQRNGIAASQQQGEAMASLNKAAMLAQSSIDDLQKGGEGSSGGGSLLQQLRRMAGQQQSINIQTEQLSQGQGMSQQQMQEMGRLAKQQDAVRKSMEELNKEAQGSPERNRIMGDLQKIADEMKEVVENLEQNNVNPNTIRQQQRILSRMLDAQTSMRERDYEQRRKSTAGTTPVRRSPEDLREASTQNQLRRDLLKAMEEGYSKDYQDLIRKYYEELNKIK